jgi:hypothetical protein
MGYRRAEKRVPGEQAANEIMAFILHSLLPPPSLPCPYRKIKTLFFFYSKDKMWSEVNAPFSLWTHRPFCRLPPQENKRILFCFRLLSIDGTFLEFLLDTRAAPFIGFVEREGNGN